MFFLRVNFLLFFILFSSATYGMKSGRSSRLLVLRSQDQRRKIRTKGPAERIARFSFVHVPKNVLFKATVKKKKCKRPFRSVPTQSFYAGASAQDEFIQAVAQRDTKWACEVVRKHYYTVQPLKKLAAQAVSKFHAIGDKPIPHDIKTLVCNNRSQVKPFREFSFWARQHLVGKNMFDPQLINLLDGKNE